MDQLRADYGRLYRKLFSGPVGVGDGTAAELRGSGRRDGCRFLLGGAVACFRETIESLEWAAEPENRLSA